MNTEKFETMQEEGGSPIKMWTRGVPVEESAKRQLANTARMPFIYKHIAVMPDVHLGKGSTIGSVVPTLGAVIPAAVGGDIRLRHDRCEDHFDGQRSARQSVVRAYGDRAGDPGRQFAERARPPRPGRLAYHARCGRPGVGRAETGIRRDLREDPRLRNTNNHNHLGTLGGGNHFVEICLDEMGAVWFMLHSGSRGVGNAIGSHFIELAKKDMRTHMVNVREPDLALSEGGHRSLRRLCAGGRLGAEIRPHEPRGDDAEPDRRGGAR